MYRENQERAKYLHEVPSLEDFIKGLNLAIVFEQFEPTNLRRISQLTKRTNQFNMTTIRREESELEKLLESKTLNAITIKVSDRFGDYGLVGLVLYKLQREALEVDTFLLSCRVLVKVLSTK